MRRVSGCALPYSRASRHQAGHLMLGERDFLAPELREREIGDLEVGGSLGSGVTADMMSPPVRSGERPLLQRQAERGGSSPSQRSSAVPDGITRPWPRQG